MKFIFYSVLVVLLVSACQPLGRGMPVTPPKPKTIKKMPVEKIKSTQNLEKLNDYPVLKLKSKAYNKDKSVLNNIPIVNKIPNIFKNVMAPFRSNKYKTKLDNSDFLTFKTATRPQSFSGGSGADGLDIGMVRLGQSTTYTRLIFDTYKWEGYANIPIHKSDHSGTYIFTYEPNNRRIIAILDGYEAFSALVGDHSDLYEGNTVVKNIHLDEYLDKSGFKFTIELKQKVKIKVYELHYPARIIIDMMPL